MRVIRDVYGRWYLLNADQSRGLPDIALPLVHQEKKDGVWKLWGWHLLYGRASVHVDHKTAKDLVNGSSVVRSAVDLDDFVRMLLAEMNAPVGASTGTGLN